MQENLAKCLHLLIEFGPAIYFTWVIFFSDQYKYGIFSVSSILIFCLFWAYFCMILLHVLGLVPLIFGMEYVTSWDKLLVTNPASLVVLTLKMENPGDLEHFKAMMEAHFSSY